MDESQVALEIQRQFQLGTGKNISLLAVKFIMESIRQNEEVLDFLSRF